MQKSNLFLFLGTLFILILSATASPKADLAAILKERDIVLAGIVRLAEIEYSQGVTENRDQVLNAQLALYRFRRDAASTLQDKIKNQELILEIVEEQHKAVGRARDISTVNNSDSLEASNKLLAEKQVLAELLIKKQKSDEGVAPND